MKIKSIQLKNFRNHLNTAVTLSGGINVLVGKNAQGKTNLLEAIYLTCVGRGWRARQDKELVNFDKETAYIKTKVEKRFGNIDIEIQLSTTKKKSAKINKVPISKVSELLGTINCVFFSPDELRLIKEAPADRRRFMDIDISQIDKNYFYALLKYNKILAQRNALLKNVPRGTNEDIKRSLDIWDAQLVEAGNIIVQRRLRFIEDIKKHLSPIHAKLSGTREEIVIEYEHHSDLEAKLKESREKDLARGFTSVGPHRDDILITISGKDVRKFASQGQQRSAALSLKLCQLEIFKEATNEAPVVLFDDVFSELDEIRQNNLLTLLEGSQAVLTATHPPEPTCCTLFHVSNGQIDNRQ